MSLVSAQSKIVVFETISEKEKTMYITRPFQLGVNENVKEKVMTILSDKSKDWSSYVSDFHEFANTADGDRYTRKQISSIEPKGYKVELITVK
ncbi:MAG: hypothetical protein NZ108_08520 [Bacteroidia bacterium]|nr:hypothetical protein [Bacteroidia bacterium]